MAMNDSEDEVEGIDDLDFDARSSDVELDDDEMVDADAEAEDGTEGGDDESASEDSDEDGEDDDEEEEDSSANNAALSQTQAPPPAESSTNSADNRSPALLGVEPKRQFPTLSEFHFQSQPQAETQRPLSPAAQRRNALVPSVRNPRSYTVEAVCAIAHPEPTHALAASRCMSHVLTGSQDGYIRDYDLYTALNGKVLLTAPQRHHCNVVEGTMKAGCLRLWWENPADVANALNPAEETLVSPVYSLLLHSDALWALAGSELGHINLFTVRHDPGRFIHSLRGHKGPVSAMSMAHDEKSFFSAGWDGDVHHWDLNTGQPVRKFYSHGAQVACVAVRPYSAWAPPPPDADRSAEPQAKANPPPHKKSEGDKDNDDAKSDASYDPLFDDEPDGGGEVEKTNGAAALTSQSSQPPRNRVRSVSKPSATPPRGPPILDPINYAAFSPDVLMTASIDGQVVLWDCRVDSPGRGVGRLESNEKTPPWCVSACWSVDGNQIYAGRRNGTVDIWDTRQFGRATGGTPRLLRTIRNPVSSGAVSCIVAFPDGNHIACASSDNIRLWNVNDLEADAPGKRGVPFKIIPGHHGGQVSQMLVDSASRFLITASSNRGWQGDSTRTVLIHDIKVVR